MDGQDLQDKKGPWWERMGEFLATNGHEFTRMGKAVVSILFILTIHVNFSRTEIIKLMLGPTTATHSKLAKTIKIIFP